MEDNKYDQSFGRSERGESNEDEAIQDPERFYPHQRKEGFENMKEMARNYKPKPLHE